MPNKKPATPAEARQWLRENGVQLPGMGKIPDHLKKLYTEKTGRPIGVSKKTAQRRAQPTAIETLAKVQTGQLEAIKTAFKPTEEFVRNAILELGPEPEPQWMIDGRKYAEARARQRMRLVGGGTNA